MQRGIHQIRDALELFHLDCEARRLTPATRQFYQAKLSVFVRWCEANACTALPDLTASDIRRFLVHISHRELSAQYQNNLARAIRAFLNYCVRDELIERSPFDKVQMPRLERRIPETMTTTEIHAVLRACESERDKAICLFLLYSGVRASELIALNVGDIDLKTGIVTVRRGKGQKGRNTVVGATTRKQFRRYLATRDTTREHDPAFMREKGDGRLGQDELVQLMNRLRGRSGVKTCRCHSFRRTFALTCLRNGMNIYVLAKLMGHADITVLRHYLALVEEDLQEAHARFGAVDGMELD